MLTASLLIAAGCGAPQSAGVPAPAPPPPPTEWPRGRAAPVTLTDELTVSIPLQYERSAINRDPGAPAATPAAFTRKEAQFDFFLPGFTGYTLENYRNESDENKVEVLYLHAGDPHEADPDAPGEYPPNMLKRSLQELLDPKHYRDQFGLRCYRGRVFTDRLTCYGRRDEQSGEDIMLTVPVPPYAEGVSFPEMQARYFCRSYGGVRITWRTHVKNLPRWREIDTQIWRFIEEWNVAPAAGAPTSPGARTAARLNRN
jgi:hypothetical protein